MSLLPSKPDASPPDDAGPRVIGVDSDDADDVLSALSSDTARELLSELHDDPAPPSELAESVDTSVQNVKYHLDKLESAGAIEVVDTAYSEKGREMDVYAPSDQPLVIFAGNDDKGSTLRTALSRLLGAVGILGVASLAVQSVFGDGVLPSLTAGSSGDAAPEPSGGGAPPEPSGGQGSAEPDYSGDGAGNQAAPEEDASGDVTTADQADGDQVEEEQAAEEPDGSDGGGGDAEAMDQESVDDGADLRDSADGGDAVDGGSDATDGGTEAVDGGVETVNETVSTDAVEPEAADAVVEGAAALPPGLLFFAGGLFAIIVVVAYLQYRG